MKRPYEEAADVMVEWWVEKSFKTPLDKHLLSDKIYMAARQTATPDNIQTFKTELKTLLMQRRDLAMSGGVYLDVEYEPCDILRKACFVSGINTRCLPRLVVTRINTQNAAEIKKSKQWQTIGA